MKPVHRAAQVLGTVALLFVCLVVCPCALAQLPSPPPRAGTPAILSTLIVRVTEGNGAPLARQALVKVTLVNSGNVVEGATRSESRAQFDQLPIGNYIVEVSAAGYRTAQVAVDIALQAGTQFVDVNLMPESAEASAPVTNQVMMAPKARVATERGLTALKAGKLEEARKQFETAYKLAPGNPDLNYLLGVLCIESKDFIEARNYLTKTTSLNPRHVPGLVALGELNEREGNHVAAAELLEQAIAVDAHNWRAFWMLASAYLNIAQYEKAALAAEHALQFGKDAAAPAGFVRGEALAQLGRREEAIEALNTFVRDAPSHSAVNAAAELIKKLQTGTVEPVSTSAASRSSSRSDASVPLPVNAVPDAKLSLPRWTPPSVSESRPPVAEGTACSLERVKEEAGKRVVEMVAGLARYTATEELQHQNLNELGQPVGAENKVFQYLVSITGTRDGLFDVEEFRNGTTAADVFPAAFSTKGVPALVLLFHPALRDDFEMNCEGLGDLGGRAAWQVYFRQRPDRPSRIESYHFAGRGHPVALQGRAWFSIDTFQILRLETDLLRPMPEIDLLTEHQAVDYGPVKFQTQDTQLWLPSRAEIFWEFRKQRYHRLLGYRDYLLFSVSEKQTIGGARDPDH